MGGQTQTQTQKDQDKKKKKKKSGGPDSSSSKQDKDEDDASEASDSDELCHFAEGPFTGSWLSRYLRLFSISACFFSMSLLSYAWWLKYW